MDQITQHPKAEPTSNAEKEPENWTTGDEAMTGAQASYLQTLCEEAGERFDSPAPVLCRRHQLDIGRTESDDVVPMDALPARRHGLLPVRARRLGAGEIGVCD